MPLSWLARGCSPGGTVEWSSHPLAQPERRARREGGAEAGGAEDGGDADEDEAAVVRCVLPRLLAVSMGSRACMAT